MSWNLSHEVGDAWEISFRGEVSGVPGASISVVLKSTNRKIPMANLSGLIVSARESSDAESFVYMGTGEFTDSDGRLEFSAQQILSNYSYYVTVESGNGEDIAIFKKKAVL